MPGLLGQVRRFHVLEVRRTEKEGRMPSCPELRRLNVEDWERLQEFVARFEKSCESEAAVDLAQFLPSADDPLRTVVLDELVKTDLEVRWRRGQPTELEHYVARFPELGELAPQLLYEEYRVRQFYGDKTPLSAYRMRFPNQFQALEA